MLRRTPVAAVFLNSIGPSRQCGVPTNENMDELIQYVKQVKKLRQYYGSHFHRIPDREAYYSCFGGPRGGRFTIRRAHSKKQFHHHNATHGRYAIHHTNPTNPWSGVGGGGAFRLLWDNQVSGTNAFWDVTFKMFGKDLSKDKAVEWMEDWGVKYKILDEVTQPRLHDFGYVKHSLYSHNFPWIKDPVTTPWQGDADYLWRGRDQFSYKEHGATTASVANEFRSLWGIKATPYAAAAAPSEKKSAKKDAGKKETAKSGDKKEDRSKKADKADGKAAAQAEAKRDAKAHDDESKQAAKQEPKADKDTRASKPEKQPKPDKETKAENEAKPKAAKQAEKQTEKQPKAEASATEKRTQSAAADEAPISKGQPTEKAAPTEAQKQGMEAKQAGVTAKQEASGEKPSSP